MKFIQPYITDKSIRSWCVCPNTSRDLKIIQHAPQQTLSPKLTGPKRSAQSMLLLNIRLIEIQYSALFDTYKYNRNVNHTSVSICYSSIFYFYYFFFLISLHSVPIYLLPLFPLFIYYHSLLFSRLFTFFFEHYIMAQDCGVLILHLRKPIMLREDPSLSVPSWYRLQDLLSIRHQKWSLGPSLGLPTSLPFFSVCFIDFYCIPS
jgi:hypothetical protein